MLSVKDYPLVYDQYLYSLDPNGIEVIDINDSTFIDIENNISVNSVLCYNKHTKQFISIKKDDPMTVVISKIVKNYR